MKIRNYLSLSACVFFFFTKNIEMILTVAASRPMMSLMSSKMEADKKHLKKVHDKLKGIAKEERQYAEKQYRWIVRQHSRTQSVFKKLMEEIKLEMNDHEDLEASCDEEIDNLDVLSGMKVDDDEDAK
ncbi:hypothetical protein TetV_061 [Tetraselmis virus 1]|uniref:Uncharacterized protein n=1 Tax=Tetraselmis virus 1 TaxID=2060617 RepID=A0A2P0VMN9_9VIRU|nr:hypothetical protein QJ968_gp061 [Tetraselmis virus 1]AUF82153.1 hypothetical protein TetV_061 [Tetraselmis virus 1]